MLIDTHCHIHDPEFYPDSREAVYRQSIDADVTMLCVGTDERSSREAISFVAKHERTYAVIGVHPHEAKHGWDDIETMLAEHHDKVVSIGEIGLDYFYEHSSKATQQAALRAQLALAKRYDLPVSFHVRDAYEDFWPIFDEFAPIRGVLHSFTDSQVHMEEGLRRGLYIGVNGISTFTKSQEQQQLFKDLPLDRIVLETDAPFLTPTPFRGKVNVPAYIGRVAEHQAACKGISLDTVMRTTTANAKALFKL